MGAPRGNKNAAGRRSTNASKNTTRVGDFSDLAKIVSSPNARYYASASDYVNNKPSPMNKFTTSAAPKKKKK